ncbi:MAG: MucB/RseB C-terminal domain-containing protein [Burkholderiaceae bacterium]
MFAVASHAFTGVSAGRTRSVAAALVVASGALLGGGAHAQELRARTDVQWIQAVRQAAQRVNYQGTVVYQAGGAMRSSRVTHLFDGLYSHERIQTLDGKPREYIRRRSEANDEVQCLIPETRRIVIEQRKVEESFPGFSNASPEEILERYTLRLGDVERVAGIECQMLTLEPKDTARYGYRLWVDRVSGLLLRAQTLNEKREVIEQVAFSDVRIGERIDRAKLRPSWSTEGWSVERHDHRKVDLAEHGWVVPAPMGFRKTREVARRIGASEAMQTVFSDGLATVSVFIEPHSLLAASAPAVDALQIHGPTSAYSRRVGDSLVTVVGEVPPSTVRAVAGSVEFLGAR